MDANLSGFGSLDVRSIIFTTAIVTLTIALGMSAVARLHPEIKGAKYWAIGCALQSIGWLLFDLRGYAPDFLAVFGGSFLPIVSLAYFYAAFEDFNGERLRRGLLTLILGVTTVAFTFFWFALPSVPGRMAVDSLGASALVSLCILALLRSRQPRGNQSHRLTAMLLAAGLAILLGRSALTLLHSEIMTDCLQRGIFNRFLYAGITGLCVLVTFGYLAMCHDRFRDEAMHLATTDSLTGVLNRRAMETVLSEEAQRSLRTGLPLSLLLLDLDHFKEINDTFGHAIGDRALQSAVTTIERQLRSFDRVGRWGGEEFLVALPGTKLSDAVAIAERLRGDIFSTRVRGERAEGKFVSLSVSVGVAGYFPGDLDYDCALRRADEALYTAKRAGRNRVTSSSIHAPGAAVATHAGGMARDATAV